tara:strand:- start:262 stop:546 length:285 start_codon:yes stop_codon:yes gene_type:complete
MRKYLIFTAILALFAANSVEAHRGGMGKGGFQLKFFDLIDANNDNKISLAEHNSFHNERFAEIDTDKNSEISLEEMMNFHRTMQEKFKGKFKKS